MIEWNVPTSLTTPAGTYQFNVFPGIQLDPASCEAIKELRTPKTPVPQGDGDILHRRWKTGYVFRLKGWCMESADAPACSEDARLMVEDLMKYLDSILNTPGRYCWTPTNYGDNRALDFAQWFERLTFNLNGNHWEIGFALDSPFPYAIDLTQQAVSIASGGLTAIVNAGNVSFYPVLKVYPASSTGTWQVSNFSTLQGIVYDGSRPGAAIPGGSYAEIDTYKSTIFLNGNGADLSSGVDPTLTNLEDPFLLRPGSNDVQPVGGSVIVLANNSWG